MTLVLGATLWARGTESGKVCCVVSEHLLQNSRYFPLPLPAGH